MGAPANLIARYGDKATALEADAVELFESLTKELSLPDLAYDAPRETDHDAVKKKLMRWVDSIAPMKAVNMVNALAESLGLRVAYVYG